MVIIITVIHVVVVLKQRTTSAIEKTETMSPRSRSFLKKKKKDGRRSGRTHVSDDDLVFCDEQGTGSSPAARTCRFLHLLAFAVLVILDHDDLAVVLFEAGDYQGPIGRVCVDPGRMVADVDLRDEFEGGGV